MAFRGRGRGRGGHGFDHRAGKHVPFTPFPEDVQLPEVPTVANEYIHLIRRKFSLENFWKASCYYLEDVPRSKPEVEIERYSDSLRRGSQRGREALASYLKLNPSNFPSELVHGTKRPQHVQKKLRWDLDSVDKKLDEYEKRELLEKSKGDIEKDKKEDSEEDDENQADEEQEGSDHEDDDYNQNVDFDDDDDGLNVEEDEHEDAFDE